MSSLTVFFLAASFYQLKSLINVWPNVHILLWVKNPKFVFKNVAADSLRNQDGQQVYKF